MRKCLKEQNSHTQISKSVASVLLTFKWHKVVLLYSKSSDRDFSAVARTIQNTLQIHNIDVTRVSTWSDTFHYGYTENPFQRIVEQTYQTTRRLLNDDFEIIELAEKSFQSYIGVVPTPPIEFEKFSFKVNQFMQLPPFNFPNPTWEWGGLKRVPAEGAYLYDAVYVYARALNDTLKNNGNPFDGKLIFKYIKNREYRSQSPV
ncbi:unnamed protein product [Oppiella nova]|uniref:Receptor ligand binding region domain-containing protein n=1 Tax=Oppiella nova TaxID=334625 RepID=A0A7R9LIF4_9ACAR|nr:unnamed protein product [Oppiella nova]CAG2163893.1 unnamed protein product [Oppiella nova]